MANYKFWKISVAASKVPTPQDWLAYKLIERHAGDLFYDHYLAVEANEKEMKKTKDKDKKKALEDQIKIDKHLAHLWWIHNVKKHIVDNTEYTQWIADLYKELPAKLKKWVDMKQWFLIASSVVGDYGPELKDVQWELAKLQAEIDKI